MPSEVEDLLRTAFPRPVTVGASGHFHRALRRGTVESIPNIETEPGLSPRGLEFYRRHEMRSVVMVPLMGQREVLGVLVVGHRAVAAFSESHRSKVRRLSARKRARSQLQARGNVAGVYGASCGSAPSDWANITHVPDVLWVANWLTPFQYRSNATVWGASCLSDTLWMNHQRIRQYAGGHNETWGSVTLNIDSNVSEGIVAFPPYKVYTPLIER